MLANLAPATTALRLTSADTASVPAWYSLIESGYDQKPPQIDEQHGLEVLREYTDDQGKPVKRITLGEAITVTVRLRALGQHSVGDVAIVDILPGGFEVVNNPPPETEATPTEGDTTPNAEPADTPTGNTPSDEFLDPLAQPGSDMAARYVEPRDDRVLIYATATRSVQQYRYRIRATTAGRFIEPPIYAESMYDRQIRALAPGAGEITVTEPAPVHSSAALPAASGH